MEELGSLLDIYVDGYATYCKLTFFFFSHERVYLKQVCSETTLSWAIPLYDVDCFLLNGLYFVNKVNKVILYVPKSCSG